MDGAVDGDVPLVPHRGEATMVVVEAVAGAAELLRCRGSGVRGGGHQQTFRSQAKAAQQTPTRTTTAVGRPLSERVVAIMRRSASP